MPNVLIAALDLSPQSFIPYGFTKVLKWLSKVTLQLHIGFSLNTYLQVCSLCLNFLNLVFRIPLLVSEAVMMLIMRMHTNHPTTPSSHHPFPPFHFSKSMPQSEILHQPVVCWGWVLTWQPVWMLPTPACSSCSARAWWVFTSVFLVLFKSEFSSLLLTLLFPGLLIWGGSFVFTAHCHFEH